MKWVTMFPQCTNTTLVKDVGMIPYVINKKIKCEASVACYVDNKDFSYINKEVKGLNIENIKKYTGRPTIDGGLYLLKNAKYIDVLNLYHITTSHNFWWVLIYKFLNPKGKVYLKLDTNYDMLQMILSRKQEWLVKNIDIISAEILDVCARLEIKWQREILFVPNGIYWENKDMYEWSDKENIIVSVGRIGTFQKNTELLLKLFADLQKENQDYTLRVIGPIESGFISYINDFFENNPQLKNKIIFVGEISDRTEMEKEYSKAKYFLYSSRWEGFGIALVEALMAGCYIISPEVDSLRTIIDDNKYGVGYPLKNEKKGVEALKASIGRTQSECEKTCMEAQKYAREKFNWENIVKPIIEKLEKEDNIYGKA